MDTNRVPKSSEQAKTKPKSRLSTKGNTRSTKEAKDQQSGPTKIKEEVEDIDEKQAALQNSAKSCSLYSGERNDLQAQFNEAERKLSEVETSDDTLPGSEVEWTSVGWKRKGVESQREDIGADQRSEEEAMSEGQEKVKRVLIKTETNARIQMPYHSAAHLGCGGKFLKE